MELRTITRELSKMRQFRDFVKSESEGMDLTEITRKINEEEYFTPQDWVDDIEILVSSVKLNDDSSIVDNVLHFRDMALQMIEYLTPEFIRDCKIVSERRKEVVEEELSEMHGFEVDFEEEDVIPETQMMIEEEEEELVETVGEAELKRYHNEIVQVTNEMDCKELENVGLALGAIVFKNGQNLDRSSVLKEMKELVKC